MPGAGPDDLPAVNLTPAGHLASRSQEDFNRTMRTGTTPEGNALDPAQMPWPITELMTDDELAAFQQSAADRERRLKLQTNWPDLNTRLGLFGKWETDVPDCSRLQGRL